MFEFLLVLNGLLIGLGIALFIYVKHLLKSNYEYKMQFTKLIDEQKDGVERLAKLQENAVKNHAHIQNELTTIKTDVTALKNKQALGNAFTGRGAR